MLAEGVGTVNGAPLDGFPVAFRTDLLIHEAVSALLKWLKKIGMFVDTGSYLNAYTFA